MTSSIRTGCPSVALTYSPRTVASDTRASSTVTPGSRPSRIAETTSVYWRACPAAKWSASAGPPTTCSGGTTSCFWSAASATAVVFAVVAADSSVAVSGATWKYASRSSSTIADPCVPYTA